MITEVYYRGTTHHKINPELPPKDVRELDSFTYTNAGCKPFVKGQCGWYKVSRQGSLLFVSRTLYLLSLREWLEIAVNDLFIGNLK